jgi:hypothetical protein
MSDDKIEQEIQAKSLTAPRVTPDDVENAIFSEDYCRFDGSTTTIAQITMKNGFVVIGTSACASLENFDEELVRKIARDNAKNKIWELLGYALKERLSNPSFEDSLDKIFEEAEDKAQAIENVKAYVLGFIDTKYKVGE